MFDLISFLTSPQSSFLDQDMWEKYQNINSFDIHDLSAQYTDGLDCSAILSYFPFYRDYVSQFIPIKIRVPDKKIGNYDWKLLLQLSSASLSSKLKLQFYPMNFETEAIIEVPNEDQKVKSKFSELTKFQIENLFKIYISEQINWEVISYDSIKNKEFYILEKVYRFQKWDEEIDKIRSAKIEFKKDLSSKIRAMTPENIKLLEMGNVIPIYTSPAYSKNENPKTKSINIFYLSKDQFSKIKSNPKKINKKVQSRTFSLHERVPFPDGYYFGESFEVGFIVKQHIVTVIL